MTTQFGHSSILRNTGLRLEGGWWWDTACAASGRCFCQTGTLLSPLHGALQAAEVVPHLYQTLPDWKSVSLTPVTQRMHLPFPYLLLSQPHQRIAHSLSFSTPPPPLHVFRPPGIQRLHGRRCRKMQARRTLMGNSVGLQGSRSVSFLPTSITFQCINFPFC